MRFSPDWWAFWAGVWAVGLTAAAALAGLVSWYFSSIVGEDATIRANAMELRIVEQQARAANAELQLAEVRRRQEPRRLNWEALEKALNGQPSGRAIIWYAPEDGEAMMLASDIMLALSKVGWQTSSPTSVPKDAAKSEFKAVPKHVLESLPAVMRVGGNFFGVSVVARSITDANPDSKLYTALSKGFLAGLGAISGGTDPELPPDLVIVVVGPKP